MRFDLVTLNEMFELRDGVLYWRARRPTAHFKTERDANAWATQWGGRKAGTLHPRDGYLYVAVRGRKLSVHRIQFCMYRGIDLKDAPREVDHENGKRTDNRDDNLRAATPCQNKHNAGLSRRNKSGFKGVSLHKRTGRWRAVACKNYRHHEIGFFDTPEAAFDAREAWISEHHGEFACNGVRP